MAYKIQLTKAAKKQLASIDRKAALLIARQIDALGECDDPCRLPNAKKLQGVDNGWRWRVGAYRILGTVDGRRIVIELFRIGHRRDAYRNL